MDIRQVVGAKVVIAQEYVPVYRVPFFTTLREKAAAVGITVEVAAGIPAGLQAARGDTADLPGAVALAQREISVAGRRLTVRRLRGATAGADLLVLEQARRNLDVYRLLLPARRPRRPAVALWGHGWDHTQDVGRVDRVLMDALSRRCDWFFGYTDASVEHVQSLGLPASRTTSVRNTVDTAALRAELSNVSAHELAAWRHKHDLRGRTALFLGGLDESKRLDLLLEGAQRAHTACPDVRLLVAGAGVLSGEVERFAENNPWCIYLGALTGQDRSAALANAEVIANPGRVGLVAVDSLVSGTPIVTVAGGRHAPEYAYLEPGRTCVAAPTEVDFGPALLGLLLDDAQRRSMTTACETEGMGYGIDTMASRFLSGIVGALQQSGLPREAAVPQ